MIGKTLASVAMAFTLTACGLESEQAAEVLEEVQFDLLATSTSTTSTTMPESPVFPVQFYWHTAGDNRLQAISRDKEVRPSAGETLRELVQGPTQEDLEANLNLQNRLDPSMEPQLFQIEDSTYQIQINWPIDEALTIEQAAEFVCTAAQFAEIDAVTIVNLDGEQFTLSGTGAVAIAGPARASDFNDCIEQDLPVEIDPDAETTTTTTTDE